MTAIRESGQVAELRARIATAKRSELAGLDSILTAAKMRQTKAQTPLFPPLLVPARCR